MTLIALIFALLACKQEAKKPISFQSKVFQGIPLLLRMDQAEELVQLPLGCIDVEYPNKLNQVIGGSKDLLSPQELHPAFYGCFDWHSSVHGHWSLVRLLRKYPNLKERKQMIAALQNHLTPKKIAGELAYFDHPLSQGFERMYGWAWLLKLSEELHRWNAPEARQLEKNLAPLTKRIISEIQAFLPKLQYPIRVGTHTNTAFAMSMIYDYAKATKNKKLKSMIVSRSKSYFLKDTQCPMTWEPSGNDFLSPCFEEIDLMRRVLPREEFSEWLSAFMPDLALKTFKLEPGIVSDRKDGHLVHIDGLNYSRAWCMFGIAKKLPEYNHLVPIANEHIRHSLPDLTDGNYEGAHWLATFALMALTR